MKGIVGYLFVAAALAVAGAGFLAAGLINRDMAHAQQSVMALKYDEADKIFANTEHYFEYASHLPWVGEAPLNDVRTRRAELRYWQGQYAAIVSPQPESGTGIGTDNTGLQLVAANAGYRAGRLQAKDKQAAVQAVEAGMQAYLGILKNTPQQEDAAYNYEYLARLRDELLEGRANFRAPKAQFDPNGLSGAMLSRGDGAQFKTRIPLQNEERDKAAGAGKIPPAKKKG
jgi:hypothetical protein